MSISAIIADDHPLFRHALHQAVAPQLKGDIALAEDMHSCMETLRSHQEVELVMLDINMPGNEGLKGLAALRASYPDVLVLVVSAETQPQVITQAMDLGASGFLPKSADMRSIREAVATVLDGEEWLEDKHLLQQSDSPQDGFARRVSELTPHQYRVLALAAEGLLNKQIAYQLSVQETTIKQHMSAILRKLGVNNRTQAGKLFNQLQF